jgi:hypothetical protein
MYGLSTNFSSKILATDARPDFESISRVMENLTFKLPLSHLSRKDFIVRVIPHDNLSIEEAKIILSEYESGRLDLIALVNNYRRKYEETDNNLYLQISRMVFKILLYELCTEDSEDFRALKGIMYLVYNLTYGSEYSKYIKKIRAMALTLSISETLLNDTVEEIDRLNSLEFFPKLDKQRKYHYDSFLNESCFILYEESSSDFEECFKKFDEDAEALQLFKKACVDLLSKNKVRQLREPDEFEVLTDLSDSCLFDDENLSSVPFRSYVRNRIEKGDIEYHKSRSNNFTFKRTIIPVSPANFRDAWECNLPTLLSIKEISYKMRQIVSNLKSSAQTDFNTAERRKRLFNKENKYFIMLDIKKCGLTMNLKLVDLVRESLIEVYGPNKTFDLMLGYQRAKIYDSNFKAYRKNVRGTGLGMANEITTLIQCVIGHMISQWRDINSLFFNDDGVYGTDRSSYDSDIDIIAYLYTRLGIELNLKKTIFSKANVFCEEYFRTEKYFLDYSKKQLMILPIADLFFQPSIVSAKRMFFSLDRNLIGTGINIHPVVYPLIKVYGYEFYKTEYSMPYSFGGWYDRSPTNFLEDICWYTNENADISDSHVIGSLPHQRLWATYLARSDDVQDSLERKGMIPFKKRIDGYDKPYILMNHSEETLMILDILGIANKAELLKDLDDCINFRGLKNAKPKIKLGSVIKLELARRKLFRRFKKVASTLRHFSLSLHDILSLTRFCNKTLGGSYHHTFPRCFVKEHREINDRELKKSNVLRSIFRHEPNVDNSRESIEIFLEGYAQHRWFAKQDVFLINNLVSYLKSGVLRSNIPIFSARVDPILPEYFKYFCLNRRLLFSDFVSKNKIIPHSFQFEDLKVTTGLGSFKNPIVRLFPSCEQRWKFLISKANFSYRPLIRDVLYKVQLDSQEECEALLDSIIETIEVASIEQSEPIFNRVKMDFIEVYLDELCRNREARTYLVPETLDSLLDDYNETKDPFETEEDLFRESPRASVYGTPRDYDLSPVREDFDTEMVDDTEMSTNELRRENRNSDFEY